MLGREHEAVVQKLYTLFELAKVHVAKAQIAEEVGIIMPGGELLHKVDVCLVICPGTHPLSLQAYATPGKLRPVLCWASAELPDLLSLPICQTSQVIHTAFCNSLKLD